MVIQCITEKRGVLVFETFSQNKTTKTKAYKCTPANATANAFPRIVSDWWNKIIFPGNTTRAVLCLSLRQVSAVKCLIIFVDQVRALKWSLLESLMYRLFQSAPRTAFSLSSYDSQWRPVGNWVLWVSCLSHFLSHTHTQDPTARTLTQTNITIGEETRNVRGERATRV